jgi:hypothetical protein
MNCPLIISSAFLLEMPKARTISDHTNAMTQRPAGLIIFAIK